MKLAVYSLAAILIAGLAVGIAFSYTPVAEVKQVTPDRGTVYVDLAALMKLHPSWQALGTMKKTLADVGAVEGSSPSSVGDVSVAYVPAHDLPSGDTGLRDELREKSVREAVGALGQLEMQRRQAIQSRVNTMRAEMVKEEERNLRLRTQDVEAEVAEQLKVVAVKNRYESINAQLRLSALNGARKTKGVDLAHMDPMIESAQSDLDRITRLRAAESNEVIAQAAIDIDDIANEAESKINATLDIYARGESRRIEEQIALAREQIISELDSYVGSGSSGGASAPAMRVKNGSNVVVKAVKCNPRKNISGDAVVLGDEISQLEAQIRSEVLRAARSIADEKGVDVVFTRGSTGHMDRTADFAKAMQGIGWGAYKPVMLRALGS